MSGGGRATDGGWVPQHPDEPRANEARRELERREPLALRTYTPTLAVIERSSGCYHWTADGRQLADFTSGVLVANLGHNPTRWWQRVLDYLQLPPPHGSDRPYLAALPLTAYNAATPLESTASRRLIDNLRRQPGGGRMEQVMWAASGSEAIQKALWAALAWQPGRDMILATRRGFHGKKGLAGAVTGSEHDPDRDPRVRFIDFPRDECSDVARRRQPLDLAPYRAELERLHGELGRRIACLVTEPYLGGSGSYHPQPEYLQLIERFCREHDVLLILDEIQSNFGRTGPMYAFTRYGVEPDVVCLGKGLGNGIPVSAAAGRRDVFAGLRYGEASDTWSGNPLACAAVVATLDEFEQGDVLERGQQLGAVLEAGLERLRATPVVRFVRGEGVVWGIQCRRVGEHSSSDVASACVAACYQGDARGRAIHLLGPLAGDVLRVSPPLTMPLDEARASLDAMHAIFQQLGQQLAGS